MAGHSRSKNGVASLAYDPAIHVLSWGRGCQTLMVRRRKGAVSNHEAPMSASSFETPLTRLLRMRRRTVSDHPLYSVPPKRVAGGLIDRPQAKSISLTGYAACNAGLSTSTLHSRK